MSRDSAASAPAEQGDRSGRPVGRNMTGSRWERFFEGGLLQGGVQGSPVLRLFIRLLLGEVLPLMRLLKKL